MGETVEVEEIIILGPDPKENSRLEAEYRKVYGPSVKIVVIRAEQRDIHIIPRIDPLAFLG